MKFLLGMILMSSALAWGKCELPPGEKIKIGCSYECGMANRLRLKIAAILSGYDIELIDLGTDLTLIDKVDGILIPGGADINARIYRDRADAAARSRIDKYNSYYRSSEEGERRDLFESQLLKQYNEDEKFMTVPLLGICRGMQMMAVSEGLPLFQDIEAELKMANREFLVDKVDIPQGPTIMSAIFPKGSFLAAKYHHQAINLPYYYHNHQKFSRIKITAYSNDKKIAEAIEYNHRHALGVQFHPEYSLPSGIFEWFLTKSCEKKLN